MPRRRKLPDIPETPNLLGLGRNGKDPHDWLVQKSNPLKSLSETDLNLVHFKILDAYLSRIDSHKPDERYVQFQKGELEKLLGVTRMHRDELDKRLDGLFRAVTIRDERKPKNFVKIGLFAKAECEQDEDGLWQVRLACTSEAMEYIFNIENIGYLRYRLHNVINLTSRYSYVMFLLLDARKNSNLSNKWEISLSELKSLLNCTAERYNEFKHFNAEILKKCCNEINEKTDIKYTYKPIKKGGRKISAVEFEIEKMDDKYDINPFTFDEMPTVPLIANQSEDEEESGRRDEICHGFSSPEFEDFTDEQLALLKDLGWNKKRNSDYQKHKELLDDSVLACEYAVSDYLRQTIIMAKTMRPKNLFLYVKKMLENE